MTQGKREDAYCGILAEELVPAQGCTEPIALAYCAAKAREVLGQMPQQLRVLASGNVIKNVKSVVVPNTGGRKGLAVAAVFGAVAGDAGKKLEVLAGVTQEGRQKALLCLENKNYCEVHPLQTDAKLHLVVKAQAGSETAEVEIQNQHTNIVRIEKNNKVLLQADCGEEESGTIRRECLHIEGILQFAQTVALGDVEPLIARQIEYNKAISTEGLQNPYGANVGKILLETGGDSVWVRVKAAAAAGSDARMDGCVLPVVINSGSGNQGMAASLPVITYAELTGKSHEQLVRALVVSNLVAIHQKTKVGRLSAYCGAVSAAAGSIAGIAWLDGQDTACISSAVVNTLANVSGILCDGAKPSCAGKIATALDAAILGYQLARHGQGFMPGEGIVKEDIEKTIAGVGDIASNGMRQTDEEILRIMLAE